MLFISLMPSTAYNILHVTYMHILIQLLSVAWIPPISKVFSSYHNGICNFPSLVYMLFHLCGGSWLKQIHLGCLADTGMCHWPSASVISPPAGSALGTCSAAFGSSAPGCSLGRLEQWLWGTSEFYTYNRLSCEAAGWTDRKTGSISTKPVLHFKEALQNR